MFNFLSLLQRVFLFCGYFTKNASYPNTLSPEDESKYLALAKQGDSDAREKLINHNLRLVAHITKKYTQSAEQDDLLSVGAIGLIKGIESFKPDKGTALATYLARCIENEVLMMLRANKRYKGTLYLYDNIGTDNEGNAYTLMEVLEQREDSVFHQVENSILQQKLREVMKNTLNKREYQIINMRFGLDAPPQTQLQTAQKLGISRSYISRIETKALAKIRAVLNREDY